MNSSITMPSLARLGLRMHWKTKVPGLLYMIAGTLQFSDAKTLGEIPKGVVWSCLLAILVQCRSVTEKQTDRQTDRWTDGMPRYFISRIHGIKKTCGGTCRRPLNGIIGKMGRFASEEVVLQLDNSKCVPALLYGFYRGLSFEQDRS